MEQARLTIPYAIADFAELRGRGYYYVDKTQYNVDTIMWIKHNISFF